MTPVSEIAKLPNLGLASEHWINAVGVYTLEQLKQIGPIQVYLRIKQKGFKPSMNLLYAMAGAIEGIHWAKLSPQQRSELILELDAALDLMQKQ